MIFIRLILTCLSLCLGSVLKLNFMPLEKKKQVLVDPFYSPHHLLMMYIGLF